MLVNRAKSKNKTKLNKPKLAKPSSSFTDFDFDGVVLEIYHESQIPVTQDHLSYMQCSL